MKRIALLAAAALGAGCVSSSSPTVYGNTGDVIVYWNFSRNTLVAPFSVLYDGNVSPGGLSRACADSGVEYVTVTDPGGALVDPQMPTISCVWNGVQGATFLSFAPGSYAFVVHGWRTVGGSPVEVHRGQGSVYVSPGASNPITVTAAGLQNDLDVFLYQGATPFVCLAGDTLGYTLVDTRPGTATVIDSISGLACGNPIAFRVPTTGIDLDGLRIRVQVSNAGAVVLDSCTAPATGSFPHFGNNTGAAGWSVGLQTPSPTCI